MQRRWKRHYVPTGALVLAFLWAGVGACARFDSTGGVLLPIAEFVLPFTPLNRIQNGNITLTSVPQTVSISAVNPSRSFSYCFGHAPSSSQSNITTCELSSTALSVNAGAANNQSVFWGVVEFALGAGVQRGSYSMSSAETTVDIPIGLVDLGRTFVIAESRTGNVDLRNADERRTVRAYLTNSSTLRLERNASGLDITVVYQVIMLSSSQVQSGLASLSGTSTNVSIAPVNTGTTFLLFNSKAPATAAGVDNNIYVRGRLSNSSTITFTRAGSTGTVDIAYFVITMVGVTTQSGTVSTSGGHGQVDLDATLSPAVDTARSIPIISNTILDTGNATSDSDQDSGRFSGQFTSSTNLRVSRSSAEAPRPADVDWFVVQF